MASTPLPKYGTIVNTDDVNLLENQQSNGESQQNSLTKLATAFAVCGHVISKTNTPPGSVVEASLYLVGASATGAWSTFTEDNIAAGIDGAWLEIAPFDGLSITREDLNNSKHSYDGSNWIEAPSSTATAITASTTQSQGQQPLTARINEVTVVAVANDVVTLPTAAPGLEITVINADSTEALQVFPASGDDIDGGATDASTSVVAGAVARFSAVDATSWYKLEA